MQIDDTTFDNFYKNKITRGFTFRGFYPPGNSNKQHICIVLNESIKNDEDVLYFFMTSKVESAKIRYQKDLEALLVLKEEHYSKYFNEIKPTCIQCGKRHLYAITYKDFRNELRNKNIIIEESIDNELIKQIEFAILDSKSYDPDEVKELFNL